MTQKATTRIEELEAKLASVTETLNGLKAKNAMVASKPALAGETFDGEKVINKVVLQGWKPTASGKGVMAVFTSVVGKANYSVFVKNAWTPKLVKAKVYSVVEHINQKGGVSHGIKIGRKATCYAKAK